MKKYLFSAIFILISAAMTHAQWQPDLRLTVDAGESKEPVVAVSGSVLHTVWEDKGDGNWEIYYKRSADGGYNWGPDTRLTVNSAESRYPYSGLIRVTVIGLCIINFQQMREQHGLMIYSLQMPAV